MFECVLEEREQDEERVIGLEIRKTIDGQILGGLWVIEMGALGATEK